MKCKVVSIFICIVLLFTTSCGESNEQKMDEAKSGTINFEQEKKAILKSLNNETEAAFRRNYDDWKDIWVHDAIVTKTYMNFADSTFSESVGWEEISQFVRIFIEEHPKPEPIPKLLNDIDVRLYGNGAWVTYEQQDSLRGLKRESRLMEKVNGDWKIVGMQTTIYGFTNNQK